MKFCRFCGVELRDEAVFCEACGTSQAVDEGPKDSNPNQPNQLLVMPKTVFYVVMLALALMGMAIIGLAARGPVTVTNTEYVTQVQLSSVSFTSSLTTTQTSTMTVASFSTLAAGPPANWFNQQYCGYPFNPYLCNEGPPVTVIGYLTSDSSCVDLYVGTGQTYVVWNLPNGTRTPSGAYQVYGFIYPDWPSTQPFPPYPFQQTLCVGTPMWAVPPYIQGS